jgi:hypothetical protein
VNMEKLAVTVTTREIWGVLCGVLIGRCHQGLVKQKSSLGSIRTGVLFVNGCKTFACRAFVQSSRPFCNVLEVKLDNSDSS